MTELGVDVVEDDRLIFNHYYRLCIITDPPTFGIRTRLSSVSAYMLLTHSGRLVPLLMHPRVLSGAHYRCQEHLPHHAF